MKQKIDNPQSKKKKKLSTIWENEYSNDYWAWVQVANALHTFAQNGFFFVCCGYIAVAGIYKVDS